ncbi:MAG: hypothetical protein KGN00_00285 [Chloroflexota bacterium]|nr:hypothetical protein [Chloroflexota bacterium]MDE3192100.1 hypothetical protein [Chloroflexota bacterium]
MIKEMEMPEKATTQLPVDQKATDIPVDEGFRRWYASCPCCLGESYPTVKAKIEREKGIAAE